MNTGRVSANSHGAGSSVLKSKWGCWIIAKEGSITQSEDKFSNEKNGNRPRLSRDGDLVLLTSLFGHKTGTFLPIECNGAMIILDFLAGVDHEFHVGITNDVFIVTP